jgi:hypothetical protein
MTQNIAAGRDIPLRADRRIDAKTAISVTHPSSKATLSGWLGLPRLVGDGWLGLVGPSSGRFESDWGHADNHS